jgi:hypothetical protein
MPLRATAHRGISPRMQVWQGAERSLARIRASGLAVVIATMAVGPAAGQELTRLGLPPVAPIEEMADVILVLKPQEKYSLHAPATVDRVVQGEIVRLEKGALPKIIVHTRNTLGSPLQAGVPVKLFLKEFKDGHAHYIIGVFAEGHGGQP